MPIEKENIQIGEALPENHPQSLADGNTCLAAQIKGLGHFTQFCRKNIVDALAENACF